ncbi:MAG TPA: GAP family protein [Streptosporangiaceae bacterium]|nr:GAP family protein [Streptosporangiaceae bacterium]
MLLQAAGFAVLAALSPTALLITAIYLGSARPRTTALCYLAGAVLISTVIGIAVLLLLRYGHFQLPGHRTPRYGLRLGLGLLILAAIAVVARRKPRLLGLSGQARSPGQPGRPRNPGRPGQPHDPGHPGQPGGGQGIVSRLVSSPAPMTAFVAGVLVFMPALTFIAAIQVIATARADFPLSTLGLLIVIVINVAFVWLPFLAYLAAPGLTTRKLTAFNAWLRARGRILLVLALLVAGAVLTVDGLLGLIRRT